MGSRNQAAATFGAGTYLALGLVGVMSTTFLNQAVTLGLDPFLRLWAETILAVVFAFVLLVSAFLIGSRTGMGSIIGGVLGALVSIIGAINGLLMLSLTIGLEEGNFGGISPARAVDVSFSYELLFLITIVVLVVGMPLALVGSFQHLNERTEEGV